MSPSGSVFSETLQEITTTKLEELSKKRSSFEVKKSKLLASLQTAPDSLARLKLLSLGVKDCMAVKTDKAGRVIRGHTKNPKLEIELKNLDSFLAQLSYDPSLSTTIQRSWEDSLMRHLDMQSLKFQYADLYAQLVTEWLSTTKAPAAGDDVDMTQGEAFEQVDTAARLESRIEWENMVFTPGPVNEADLKNFLAQLFGINNNDKKAAVEALQSLKKDIADCELLLSKPNRFTLKSLRWVISGLLASNLLTDEKRQALRDFQASDVILTEVADLLNMRMAALDTWSWGNGVVVEQQRQINGIYNIRMHEDLLQAIFLYFIGVTWSVSLKKALKKFQNSDGAWKSNAIQMSLAERQRLEYYVGSKNSNGSVQNTRRTIHADNYFAAQLLDHVKQGSEAVEGEEEADFSKAVQAQRPTGSYPVQAAQARMGSMMPYQAAQAQQAQAQAQAQQRIAMQQQAAASVMQSATNYYQPKRKRVDRSGVLEYSDDDSDDNDINLLKPKKSMETKHRLLHILSTEIAVNTRVHGELTAFHTVFNSWNSLLPHATILGVLSFFGVSDLWLGFFTKFLQAPLKFEDDDESTGPKTRRRGTPASHALSDFFGESVFFCLDYAVNQSTSGGMIHRMYDDVWFWSPKHQVAVTAWKSVQDFLRVTGTSLNLVKTGAVRISNKPGSALGLDESMPRGDIRWGFLQLSPETGRFEIDQKMVDDHIKELSKQLLDKRKSVFAFIQAWNTFVSTFFTSNFGKPANCFGRTHVDKMLATHNRIQQEIFSQPDFAVDGASPASVVDYLKKTMTLRFGVSNIPDAYLFFPVELGGLDLKSPFISILPVREAVLEDPSTLLDAFEKAERRAYGDATQAFEHGRIAYARARLATTGGPRWEPGPGEPKDKFLSFADFTKYREEFDWGYANQLRDVFKKLLETPAEASLDEDGGRLINALQSLNQQAPVRGITSNWHSMEPYWKWVASLYGPEVLDRFGGLNLVDPGLLPMGMVSVFRDRRVKWQG